MTRSLSKKEKLYIFFAISGFSLSDPNQFLKDKVNLYFKFLLWGFNYVLLFVG